MAETMLVTQALDERDLLVEKINDKIRKFKAIDNSPRCCFLTVSATANRRRIAELFCRSAELNCRDAGLY